MRGEGGSIRGGVAIGAAGRVAEAVGGCGDAADGGATAEGVAAACTTGDSGG
jgi:hypothetical protein